MHRSPLNLHVSILGLALASSLSSQTASYTTFGSGCPGVMGTPVMAAAPGQLPCIGTTFTTEVSNIPFQNPGIGITGRSNTLWNASPLPFDLSAFGMPGCLLYTDLRFTPSLVITMTGGSWDTNIPNDVALIGQSFYQQALVVDMTIPGLGTIMSNAAHAVIGGQPDLLITTGMPSSTPNTIPAGLDVLISNLAIMNQGIGPAAASTTGWYLSTDNVIDAADTLLTSAPLAALAAGASDSHPSTSVTIPISTTPGSYFVGMLADKDDVLIESDETNNSVSAALTVTATGPDLIVSTSIPLSIVPNPILLSVGAPTGFLFGAFEISNLGMTTTGAFRVGVYLSADNVITPSDTLLVTSAVTSLGASASLTLGGSGLSIPAGTIAGTYWIGVIVDDQDAVAETDENNNSRRTTVFLL